MSAFGTGISSTVSAYSCPVCARSVPPLGWIRPEAATNGHSGDANTEELPVESRTCPACRTLLQRKPPGDWQTAPSLRGKRKPRKRFQS